MESCPLSGLARRYRASVSASGGRNGGQCYLEALAGWGAPDAPMADQPDTFADDDTAVGDRAVLSTKLHVPRPPPTFVLRPRRSERLDGAGPGTMVLVCAPAG